MLPTLLFAVAVFVPAPPLSPEPLTVQPPPPVLEVVDMLWQGTHPPGFIPPALRPKPKPKPTPKPQSSKPSGNTGMGSNVEQWRGLVAEYFNPADVDVALCVMAGESGGNPTADNPRSSARGLWQFLKSTWDGMVPGSVTGGSYDSGAVTDPVASTRAAAWLWYNVGPRQWNAYSRC